MEQDENLLLDSRAVCALEIIDFCANSNDDDPAERRRRQVVVCDKQRWPHNAPSRPTR